MVTSQASPAAPLYVTGRARLPRSSMRAPVFVGEGNFWQNIGETSTGSQDQVHSSSVVPDSSGRIWQFNRTGTTGSLGAWKLNEGSWHDTGTDWAAYNPVADGTRLTEYDVFKRSRCQSTSVLLSSPGWASYYGNKLFFVTAAQASDSDAGLAPVMQIGVSTIPTTPKMPAVDSWHLCVGFESEAAALRPATFPGPPAVSSGGRFAVPQAFGTPDRYIGLAEGSFDSPMGAGVTRYVLEASGDLGCNPAAGHANNSGYAAYDRRGVLYVGAVGHPSSDSNGVRPLVLWSDGGRQTHAVKQQLNADQEVGTMWLAGNAQRDGVLLVYSLRDCASKTDTYYAAHVLYQSEPDRVRIRHTTRLTERPVPACSRYAGASLGPDGRAHVAVYVAAPGTCNGQVKVFSQISGPKL